jgi:hypothetical protein
VVDEPERRLRLRAEESGPFSLSVADLCQEFGLQPDAQSKAAVAVLLEQQGLFAEPPVEGAGGDDIIHAGGDDIIQIEYRPDYVAASASIPIGRPDRAGPAGLGRWALPAVMAAVVAIAGTILLLGQDGGGDGAEPSDIAEADVVAALNLREDPNDVGVTADYITEDGDCRIFQILLGEGQVAAYGATDPIATNEDNTVGARVNPELTTVSDADCVESVSAQLDEAF